MANKIAIVLAIPLGLVALIAVVGMLLPSGHVAAMRIRVNASPDTVWTAITDFRSFPQWRTGIERVDALESGEGWTEVSGTGPLTLLVDETDPPRRLVMSIAPGGPFGGTWTYELDGDSTGTTITITERGEVYNPMFRTISKFLDQRATIRAYLTDLGDYAGIESEPEIIE